MQAMSKVGFEISVQVAYLRKYSILYKILQKFYKIHKAEACKFIKKKTLPQVFPC